jgi:galactose mutarotase-like enzyme
MVKVESNYGCGSKTEIKPAAFHRTIDGSQVDLYTLRNSNGLEAEITNYGGIAVSLTVPDKNAKFGDVVLGYDNLNDYIGSSPYFGALIGRCGNRIAKGRFTLDGVEYQLAQNDGSNALHGGRTPFDFNKPSLIGARVHDDDDQLKFAKGYDHNWVLDRQGTDLELVASLYEPTSGRLMEVLTTEPGLQFYSGNFLDGTNKGKDGTVYQRRTGVCLETQHFPNSPNRPEFPTTELKPHEKYNQTTVYRFSTK